MGGEIRSTCLHKKRPSTYLRKSSQKESEGRKPRPLRCYGGAASAPFALICFNELRRLFDLSRLST